MVFMNHRLAQLMSVKIAEFGPALVAMLVSAIAYPRPRLDRARIRRRIFGGVWLVSWVVLLIYVSFVLQVPLRVEVIVGFAACALLPAWVISGSRSSIPGVRAQSSTLWKPHGPLIWYVVALLTYPIILFTGAVLTKLMGQNVAFRDLTVGNVVLFPVLMFAEGYLTSGGVNEESGWRGFLQRHLQRQQPVLVAAIVVWFFWAMWHLPLDIAQSMPVQQILENRTLFNLPASVLFAWVYNRTKGSIVAAAIFHASMNTASVFIPVRLAFLVPVLALVAFALVYDRMWKCLPEDHPAVRKPIRTGADATHDRANVR